VAEGGEPMCDWIEGQLIISFPENDPVAQYVMEVTIRGGQLGGVSYQQSLSDRIGEVSHNNVYIRPNLGYQVHLITVPPQEEARHITLIQAAVVQEKNNTGQPASRAGAISSFTRCSISWQPRGSGCTGYQI
jgi:hypothetical protein